MFRLAQICTVVLALVVATHAAPCHHHHHHHHHGHDIDILPIPDVDFHHHHHHHHDGHEGCDSDSDDSDDSDDDSDDDDDWEIDHHHHHHHGGPGEIFYPELPVTGCNQCLEDGHGHFHHDHHDHDHGHDHHDHDHGHDFPDFPGEPVIIPEMPTDCFEPLPEGGCGHPIPLPPHHSHGGHLGGAGGLINVESGGTIGAEDINVSDNLNDALQVNNLGIIDNGNNADIM